MAERIKTKLKKIGKELDEKIGSTKKKSMQTTGKLAKYAGKKVIDGTTELVSSVGDIISKQIDNQKETIKKKLEIRDEMDTGQKAGKVVEKMVNIVSGGIKKLSDKIDNNMQKKQAQKFASAIQLKIPRHEELIGEYRYGAITIQRVESCKDFVRRLKKELGSNIEERKEIIKDAIISASTTIDELLFFLKDEKSGNFTKAEVEYINREIKILINRYQKGGQNGKH